MKALILAGGKGTRFLEETNTRPKPMIEINGKPMLLHIIEQYILPNLDFQSNVHFLSVIYNYDKYLFFIPFLITIIGCLFLHKFLS